MGFRDWLAGLISPSVKYEQMASEVSEGRSRLPAEQKSYSTPDVTPSHQQGRPVWKDWDGKKAIEQGYEGWVFACVKAIATAVGSAQWVSKQGESLKSSEPNPSAPIGQLINGMNPDVTTGDMFELVTSHMYLTGNAIWTLVQVGGVPAEIWPQLPTHTTPVVGEDKLISRYDYDDGTVDRSFDAEETVHFMFPDPQNFRWGMGKLEAAARPFDTDAEAADWQKVSLQNRAVTDGVFSFDKPLTQEQWDQARKRVKEQHQGAENARTPWVLSGGAKWNQMSLSPAEMDFIESRMMTRQEMCGIFGVPPPIVGIYDDATLANIETAERLFWENEVIPFLSSLRDSINRALQPFFGSNQWIDFELPDQSVFLALLERKMEIANDLFSKGVPMDAIDDYLNLGLPDYPGKDLGYISGQMMPAGGAFDINQPPFDDE